MLQGGGIDPRARPRETLRQYGRFHADPRDADELLDLVGLRGRRPRRATGGCRAASGSGSGLALALVGRPEVVHPRRADRRAWIRRRARRPGRSSPTCATRALAILLTSHDLTDVERLADRIVVLDGGRVVASGTPAELAAGAIARLRFRLDRPLADGRGGEPARRRLAAVRPGATVVADGDGGRYRIDGAPPDAAHRRRARRMVRRVPTGSSSTCATAGGSLEDVYLELVAAGRGRHRERAAGP